MRRALLNRMPAILMDYGVRPWEFESFTFDELNALLKHQTDRWAALTAAAKQQRRR